MRPVPSPGPAAYSDYSVASAKVRFRRALALLLMTLVLPGSAQLVAGHRTTGRVALRVWLGLAALVTFVALIAFKWHGFGFWLGTNTTVLAMVRFGLCLLAVGWAFLFLDAWRLGNPLALLQRHRLAMVGINGLLCFSVAGSLLFVSHVFGDSHSLFDVGFISDRVGSLQLALLMTSPTLLILAAVIAATGLRSVRRDVQKMEDEWADRPAAALSR